MANIKSSKKDIRRIKKRRARNIPQKTRLRSFAKKFYLLIEQEDWAAAQRALALYHSYLDRAARRSLIPAARAKRKKSRSARMLYTSSKRAAA